MNKARRAELYKVNVELQKLLDDLINRVEAVRDEEEEAKDNIIDYPQFEGKAMDMEQSIDAMESASKSLEEAIESLEEARSY